MPALLQRDAGSSKCAATTATLVLGRLRRPSRAASGRSGRSTAPSAAHSRQLRRRGGASSAAGPSVTRMWNCAASRMRTPSSSALASFEPAPGPAATKSVFFDTLDAALPPALMIASCAPSRRVSLERSGRDDRQPLEHAALDRRPRRDPGAPASPAARRRPSSGRRSRGASRPRTSRSSESAMIPPTPSTAASSSRDAARIASTEPNHCASARAATGPTWRMLSATRKRHSSLVFAASRFASSCGRRDGEDVAGVAVERAVGVERRIALLALAPERRPGVGRAVLEQARKAGLGIPHHDVDRRRGPRARRSNSPASVTSGGTSGRTGWVSAAAETSPSPSMSSAPRDPMCSTRPRTCAGHERAFGQRRSMSPSFAGASGEPHSGHSVGHHERALGAVAQLDDRAEHLGDHVAGLAQHDGVADQHALGLARRPGCAASPAARRCPRRAPAPSPRTASRARCGRPRRRCRAASC